MQSLELSDATTAKKEGAPMTRHRRHCKRMPLWTLFLFVVSAVLYFALGFRGSREEADSFTQSQEDMDGTVNGGESSIESMESLSSPTEDGASNECHLLYECQTDRMGHESPLYAGQGLCNDQFRFGITPDGIFQWHDCETNVKKVVYNSDDTMENNNSTNADVFYFSMSPEGTLRLYDDSDQIIWQKESKLTITVTEQCLHRPLLDCPYLHLHKSGDVVLNSVNARTGSWSDRKIERAFDNLYH